MLWGITPFYTKFRNREDAPIAGANFPKEAARQLAEVQWKKPDGEIAPTPSSLSNAGSNVKSTTFESHELDHALAQIRIKKHQDLTKYLPNFWMMTTETSFSNTTMTCFSRERITILLA